MSKIARIYQGTNEIQKYYQGGVLQRLFFDWKHYIGNELNIEYAKECAGRNVVISGKTIQDSNDLSNIESIGEKEDNLVTIRNYNYKCETDNIVLPDGTKNEINYSNGKHIHTRKIGKYIISGGSNETILIRKNLNNSEYITFNIDIQSNMENAFKDYSISKEKMICDKLEISLDEFLDSVTTITKEAICMRSSRLGFCISILRSKLETEDADGFRTWLSNNPITVYYELYSFVDTDLYYDDITYKLDEPLRSLTDKIYDYIKEGKIVRKIGKYTFTNKNRFSSPFGSGNPNNGTRLFETNIIPSKTSKIICDKFNYVSYGDINDSSKIAIARFGNSGNLIFRHNSTSLQEFQNYLSENPVTVYYELETPIETEITPDMILINGEPIADTINVELPNGVKDSIENGCYVKRVGKVIIDGKNGAYQRSGTSTSTLNVYVVRYLGINIALKGMNTNYIYQCDSEIDMSKYITVGRWLSDSTSGSVVFKVPTEEYLWSDIRNAFLENPITLYVELATPVKIPLFSIKEGLTTLKSTNNITPQIELDCLVRDGFQNMCDNEWERGDIDLNTGVNKDPTDRIRLVNDIQVKSNTTYRIDTVSLMNITTYYANVGARYYDISKTYISGGPIGNIKSSTYTFTTPKDCYYIRFIAETKDINFKIYLREVIK